ncbi:hypothetical protein F5Y08DRAFT_342124 [Xylaria arbuscula]|nr:hypothetical protein F5Y08DRAFT_342124 [Xylaria arbuscula]
MQAIERSCKIKCDITPGVRKIVYSTDPTACPTFLHMHNDKGYCMPDAISTSSLIIKSLVPNTSDLWEFFYVTSDLQPAPGHSVNRELEYRPVRLGKCVPVGMKVNYPVDYEPIESQQRVELIHIHPQENESRRSFEARILKGSPGQRAPMLLQELSFLTESPMEFHQLCKKRGELSSFTIERYQQTLFVPPHYSEYGRGEQHHWQVPLHDEYNSDVVRLSGSDNGSLVFQANSGLTPKSSGKILGMITAISTWSRDGDYAIVQPMIYIAKSLEERLHHLLYRRK